MVQDIQPKKYHVEYEDRQPGADARVLLYQKGKTFLCRRGDEVSFPVAADFAGTEMNYRYLFRIDDEEYYLGEMKNEAVPEKLTGEGYVFTENSIFRFVGPKDLAFAGITGYQLWDWYRGHAFCGCCGSATVHDDKERMMRCPKCGRMYYPQICPGVIVAVVHKGKLLMSKYAGRDFHHFALIAGFNETGESLEDTVHREVMEEVGLRVKNLRFYKSQPWPFTSTLLVGFFCELDGDDEEITLDRNELAEAGFYSPDEVPEDTEHVALTAEMMTVFKKNQGLRRINE
ncbi:MAG: NAD(+) diphosphatase [Eubacterium sp.]|nr:NAD(+) diphosphatase [Eubacterium sp.]